MKVNSSSDSARSQKFQKAHFVRFTVEQNEKIHKIIEYTGGSIQAFLHESAMTAIDKKLSETAIVKKPQGFGLRKRMSENPMPSFSDVPETSSSPPIQQIVISGTTVATEIERIATFVAKGRSTTRNDRMKIAVEILSVSSKDIIERDQLIKALDEKLLILEGEKHSPFDFITDFFKA